MSITVNDILKLPSLSSAQVVAGSGGLKKTVTSITVLEYANTEKLQEDLFESKDFLGSELVITAFANIREDVKAQCTNIKRLAGVGEVGMVLYYVGVIMPKIDERLLSLANKLDFVLICMPKNKLNLRYSEVIVEVMEAIIEDRAQNKYFVSEILDNVAKLTRLQQNVETVLKMTSDRLKASIILTDENFKTLNMVCWPRSDTANIEKLYSKFKHEHFTSNCIKITLQNKELWVSRTTIEHIDGQHLNVFIAKEAAAISDDYMRQTAELIKISLNLWSQKHAKIVLSELVRAILSNEPMNMRRLANFFNIDIASINTMWVIKPPVHSTAKVLSIAKDLLRHSCSTLVADVYKDYVVIFIDNKTIQHQNLSLAQELYDVLTEQFMLQNFVICTALSSAKEVRRAFLDIESCTGAAKNIFKTKNILTYSEILFAKQCKMLIESGDENVNNALSTLNFLNSNDKAFNFNPIETLQIFLIDADSSVALTSEIMFVHKNTIKYRIAQINERLCFNVTKMPEATQLYTSCAIKRLLN